MILYQHNFAQDVDFLKKIKKNYLLSFFADNAYQQLDHVSNQTVITNNSQLFVWRGIG
jgi:hypothetical protein